jgi:hypothetical protein
VFEGQGQQARQYYRVILKSEGGHVFEERAKEPSYAPIMRHGKTARDAAAGAPKRDAANKSLRADWSRETHRGRAKGTQFPSETCNGRESQALKAQHVCNRPARPGKKGGGHCQHKRKVT